jgi:hypothetical protein
MEGFARDVQVLGFDVDSAAVTSHLWLGLILFEVVPPV